MSQSLTWNGDALTAKMRKAQIAGVNATMADCVVHAKVNHTWKNQSGVLEGSIDIAEYAHVEGEGVSGVWGSKDVKYARIHELGGVIRPKNKQALKFQLPDGSYRIVKSVTIRKQPYLRPAADVHYPDLPLNIRKAFEAQGGSRA
ncbi:MAG: phage morphogenesis protein [Pseudomonadota bacterium]